MKNFKDTNNNVHVVEEGFEHLLPEGCAEITQTEVATLIEAKKPKRTKQDDINTIESTVTPRRIREAVLGVDNGWLLDIDVQIKELRRKL